ncbi:hypothetical protein [Collimonas humicola]|uniref:hypothetical protein n=1 Tax=Collimonas humicola TaxID=2825886 RepID=UPI001B8CE409|nr:hypothetical protein [Collimonas humicola]
MKNINLKLNAIKKQNLLVEKKSRDQRLALVFESEQYLLGIGAPVNYYRYGILMLQNVPNGQNKSGDEIIPKSAYNFKDLVAFLAKT